MGLLLAGLLGVGQWLDHPTPDVPRTRDGKPNLAAPAPRGPDGKPDLSGIWQVESTPRAEMERLFGRFVARTWWTEGHRPLIAAAIPSGTAVG
jgi:hypothetical protein